MRFMSFSRKKSSSIANLQLPDGLSRAFDGCTEEELGAFVSGKVEGKQLSQLFQELEKGETIIGLDDKGELLRVVSVAKPILVDLKIGEILVEVVQSELGSTSKNIRVKATGMSEKFNPLKETSQEACCRALKEELQWNKAVPTMFSSKCLKLVEVATSEKFQGLKSEYHLYIHMIKPSIVPSLQEEVVPRGTLRRVDENCELDPRSLWWSWVCPRNEADITEYLSKVSKDAGFEDLPLGRVDKFGKTPAGTIIAQMEMGVSYLDELMH